ncbi:AI-2E family transporter [Candidatus Pacearchaeota archaeon]|nr:AI-2E family transporter [Candidatus Pacearchaeota archaeon]
MEFNEKDIKKFSMLAIIVLFAFLTFLVIRPILMAVLGALILAYLFMPLHIRLLDFVKNRSVSASIVSFILILVVIVPIWFLIPIVIPQVSEILRFAQIIDVQSIIKALFPTASDQFTGQMSIVLDGFVSNLGRAGLEKLTNALIELPRIALQLFIICFVFFFTLRDHQQFRSFMADLSPFAPSKQKILIQHFKDVADSVIYGQIIIGLVQGALAGIGFLLFGVKNALALTILATLLSITPIVGPFIVWVPISIYLFAAGNMPIAIGYLLYNALIVSTVDNILRSYLVSRRTNLSPAIILIGMVGGFFIFGVMGIILGPLILAYFLVFLKSYKDKTLYTLFSDSKTE